MKAAIHNQYLDTLGGGERYTLFFAKALKELGFDVYVEWYDTEILDKSKNKFGESFDFIKIVDDIKRGDGYDLTLWISDGSIPTLRSRKNIIHFQVPFRGVNGNSLINKMKLYRVNKIICNSLFTKKIIDHEYGVKSLIVYPPVDTKNIKPLKKENIILFVGRFSGLMQSKGQHVLVEVFKKMYQKGDLKNWKLILAGGTEVK
jgi:glycosyltransferase involved in cell wall biosynthesis